ncbi:hypothetical protein IAR55_002447 [Kwoniella newhampshirensis]|uniref:RNA-dependent RNA polymerase n=1 Tax=Kwoniella newhampshirensis TaxID=1651941 RepID=A0AAW0YSN9_9TREE
MDEDGDLWDLSSYHQDVQDAYNTLRSAVPALGPFRRLETSSSDVHQSALASLQILMSCYQPFFIDFVTDNYGTASLMNHGRRTSASTGMTQMINPLLTLATRLKVELRKAQKWAEELKESQGLEATTLEVEEREVRENRSKEELHESDLSLPTSPPSLPRQRGSEAFPSKRASMDHHSSEINKKLRSAFKSTAHERPTRPSLLPATPSSSSLYPSTISTASSTSTSTASLEAPITCSTESTLDPSLDSPSKTTCTLRAAPLDNRVLRVTSQNGYQAMLNKRGVRFHVQWELERLIGRNEGLSWSHFTPEDFIPLCGPVTNAAKHVEDVLLRVVERKNGTSLPRGDEEWLSSDRQISGKNARMLQEVEREEASIVAGDLKGVGNDSIDWPFGGKINYTVAVVPQIAKIDSFDHLRTKADRTNSADKRRQAFAASTRSACPIDTSDNPLGPHAASNTSPSDLSSSFKFQLRAPSMPGKSHRLARRFGSRRVITFKVKDCLPKYRDQVVNLFVGRVFVVFGRPYRAIWAPADGDTIFGIETPDEGPEILKSYLRVEPTMPSFDEMFARVNDLHQKPNQAMAKWASRPQILFSDSVPAARVHPSAIAVVPDIVTSEAKVAGDAKTEQILTDGCGLMSESLALRIFRHPSLQLTTGRPSVVQMRLGGSKGLLAIMSPAQAVQYPGKEVILRESMVKALSAPPYIDDPSLHFVDVLRCDSLRIGTTLSSEAIIAMAHGGVPSSVFLKMAEDGLNALRDDFLPRRLVGETEDDVLVRIHAACFRRGGVGTDRKKRLARAQGLSARVAGVVKSRSEEGQDEDDAEDYMTVTPSKRFDVDPVSGQPGGIAESLMEAVAAGFHPSESAYTGSKLHHLVDMLSSKMVREFKIPVDQSLSAFIIPDTSGVLAPDELYISFSGTGPVDPETQCPIQHLEGPCLAFRSPCKLPTDVRKFKAVWKQDLAHLKDCIVLSANASLCKRSPASYLGGGDYDGDTVQLFWGKELVDRFSNADDSFADVPEWFGEGEFH